MKKLVTPLWLLAIFFLSPFILNAQSFTDDFESYNVGDYVGSKSSDWTTWSGTTGGAEDAKVVDDTAASGNNSIYFKGTANGGPQDVVLLFHGLYETGMFEYSMKLFVPSGKGGYFNFQGDQTIGNIWSVDCNINTDGSMDFSVPASGAGGSVQYTQDNWFELKVTADMNTNIWKVFIDGNQELEFQNVTNKVASIDLFPIDASSEFWVDDVSYNITPYTPAGTNASAFLIGLDNGLVGQEKDIVGTIKNLGVTDITSFDLEFSYDGNTVSESVTGITVPSLGTHEVSFSGTATLAQGNKAYSLTVSNVNGLSADDNPADDSKSLSIQPVSPAPGKIVVAEEGTGAWCQWCPRGAVAMDAMQHDFEGYFAGIAVHNGDPMAFDEYDQGLGGLISGYPSAVVDRGADIDPGVIEMDFMERIQMAPAAVLTNGVSIADDSSSVAVSVTAKFGQAISGDWRMVCVLTEDGINRDSSAYAQSNAYAGGSNGPMGGYENLPSKVPASQMIYDHVARAISPSFEGTPNTFGASASIGDEETRVYYFNTGALWDLSKMHVVGILLDENGRINNASYSSLFEGVENGFTSGEDVTGVETPDQPDAEFSIYPNPANQSTTIRSSREVNKLQVFDVTGKLVYEDNQTWKGYYRLNQNSFGEGVFIINLFNNQGEVLETEKLIFY